MTRPTPRRFVLTLQDAGGTDVPVVSRLKLLLKHLLRSHFRLRCVRAVEEQYDEKPVTGPPNGEQG